MQHISCLSFPDSKPFSWVIQEIFFVSSQNLEHKHLTLAYLTPKLACQCMCSPCHWRHEQMQYTSITSSFHLSCIQHVFLCLVFLCCLCFRSVCNRSPALLFVLGSFSDISSHPGLVHEGTRAEKLESALPTGNTGCVLQLNLATFCVDFCALVPRWMLTWFSSTAAHYNS